LIVDTHAHMGKLPILSPKVWMTPERLVETADRLGIEKMCVSSLKALTYDFYEGNQDVVEAMKRYPGRILGYVVVNPRFGAEAVEEEDGFTTLIWPISCSMTKSCGRIGTLVMC